jgi:hypothetical protein
MGMLNSAKSNHFVLAYKKKFDVSVIVLIEQNQR